VDAVKALAILQNADFEAPGFLPAWAESAGFSVRCYCAFDGELPPAASFSHLVVLGTPHSVQEIDAHPWLRAVRSLVEDALANDRAVLGICFGAQLLAYLFGARVEVGPYAEIGWHSFPAEPWPTALPRLGSGAIFQWHREYFTLPEGCESFGATAAGYLAGFCRGPRVLGLSGHIEITPALVQDYITLCWDEETHRRDASAGAAGFRQSPAEMKAGAQRDPAFARSLFLAWLNAK
jgi:GMP synthase-like glutamine amidotransferase